MTLKPGKTGAKFFSRLLIHNINGNLRHVFRSENEKKLPFSEIYFSEIKPKNIKAWKYHELQTQNISVAYGNIRIICVNGKVANPIFEIFDLNSEDKHGILTIPKGIHYGLINYTNVTSILLNGTDIPHDIKESLSLPLDYSKFWPLIKMYGTNK